MRPPLSIFVRAGTLISAGVWNAMAAAVRSLRLIAGPGVMLRVTPDGTIITFDGGNSIFLHPFKVSLLEGGAKLRPGLVNGIEATIDGKPLTPDKETGVAPQLEWSRPKLDATGRGWIAVEVSLGKSWEVLEKGVAVVQVASLDTIDGAAPKKDAPVGYAGGGTNTLPGRRARHPIAMLRQRADGRLVAFQVTHFDLRHRAAVQTADAASARHFFFSAT